MVSRLQYVLIYTFSGLVLIVMIVIAIFLIRYYQKLTFPYSEHPTIVLSSYDSPKVKEKRLWSPPEHAKNREIDKRAQKAARKEVRSYWFPKHDIRGFLPPVKGEYLQPSCDPGHHDDVVKGRLKFSFSYDYNADMKRSILTVNLHHGRDYTTIFSDDLPMDTFVKTKLLPSNKQTFTSKVRRRSLNPNYNESYYFDISHSQLTSQILCFEVHRFDCISTFEIFGRVAMPFKDIGTHGSNVIKEVTMTMNIVDHVEKTAEDPALDVIEQENNNYEESIMEEDEEDWQYQSNN